MTMTERWLKILKRFQETRARNGQRWFPRLSYSLDARPSPLLTSTPYLIRVCCHIVMNARRRRGWWWWTEITGRDQIFGFSARPTLHTRPVVGGCQRHPLRSSHQTVCARVPVIRFNGARRWGLRGGWVYDARYSAARRRILVTYEGRPR